MARRINMSTHMQAIRVYEKLKEVIKTLPEGRCEYIDPNITDQTVAELLQVGAGTVASIRKQGFGQLIMPRSNFLARLETAISEIEQLKTSLREVTALAQELSQKHTALVRTLALNKVADVRHLVVNEQRPEPPRSAH